MSEKLGQLQMLEQNLQNLVIQKQQVQSELMEAETASKELKTTKSAFKIVGNIMIQKDKAEITADLDNKTQKLNIRIKSIEKQEDQIREKVKKLQEEVMKDM